MPVPRFAGVREHHGGVGLEGGREGGGDGPADGRAAGDPRDLGVCPDAPGTVVPAPSDHAASLDAVSHGPRILVASPETPSRPIGSKRLIRVRLHSTELAQTDRARVPPRCPIVGPDAASRTTRGTARNLSIPTTS